MSKAVFIEFHSLEFKADSNGDRRCAAVLSPGRDRCSELFSQDSASKLHALYGKLQDNDDIIDNAARAHILEQIARLCLCEAHAQDHNVTAAVLQWESHIQSPAGVRPADPQTPITKKVKDQGQIFKVYTPEKSKIKPDNPTDIDRQVRKRLGEKIENKDKAPDHLYVFSYEGAKDLYKVGRTQHILTRVSEHEKCYSGLKLHCFVECPNAGLFESVVHEEFRQYRRTYMCQRCKKKDGDPVEHKEWFQAPLRDILDSVTAWSLYARMLYGDGLSIDRNYQNLPTPGFLSRPDRWRRWALAETMRWMDMEPSQVAIVPERSKPTEIKESESEPESDYESASETASVFSGHGSPSETPGTTPGTTPGITPLTNPESLDNKRDYYSLSPAPAKRYTGPVDLPGENEEDEDEYEDDLENSHQRVERALFTSPPFKKPISPHSTEESSAANLDTSSASHTSSTDIPLASSILIDDGVRRVLEKITQFSEKPGTIYLTPPYPKKESYKIYSRRKGASRGKECYSNPKPQFEIECTNTQAIQKLVLAEFGDRTQTSTCGTKECSTQHRDWINAPGKNIEASLQAWSALMEAGYERTHVPGENLSRGEDRWRKWAMETAGKIKEEKRRNAATKGEKQPTQEEKQPTQEEKLPLDVDRESVKRPPTLRRAATDLILGFNSRESGSGRTSSLWGRVSWRKLRSQKPRDQEDRDK